MNVFSNVNLKSEPKNRECKICGDRVIIDDVVTALNISVMSENIQIQKGNKLTINYYGNTYDDVMPQLDYAIDNGTLTVKILNDELIADMAISITVPDYVRNFSISSMIGDICFLDIDADDINLSSASGYIEAHPHANNLKIETISGDIFTTINSHFSNISSTSGKINVHFKNAKEVECKTISGNIIIDSPYDVIGMSVLHSLSGKVNYKCKKEPKNNIIIKANSVSGNITVK